MVKRIYTALIFTFALISIAAFTLPSAAKHQSPDVEHQLAGAGNLVRDMTTDQPAVGALPVDFVRSPDHDGPDGKGRYLVSVNSGYGLQFNAASNVGQQSLAVIDLKAQPAPVVIQNVYFPAPQSVNVGVIFGPSRKDGSFPLYVSGGFENKIWIFRFQASAKTPITPVSAGPDTSIEAPFIDVSAFATATNSPRYNSNHYAVYPTGLALSQDGNTLFMANNLADSLGIVDDINGARTIESIRLRGRENKSDNFTYPYGVVAVSSPSVTSGTTKIRVEDGSQSFAGKVYVSCWNDSSVAVIDYGKSKKVSYIPVGHHPTAMVWSAPHARLYVANSDDDTVSLIDTNNDREVERINVKLAEGSLTGNSPEAIALDDSGTTLYVANAHSNSIAVVTISERSLDNSGTTDNPAYAKREKDDYSRVRGFIPTGRYPSALAVVNKTIFYANGKGTGLESSSLVVNNSGRTPNSPNDRFPAGTGRGMGQGGQYSVSLVTGNISSVLVPDDATLAAYTRQVMQSNNLIGAREVKLFRGPSPIKHVIYVIKENRTYDQIYGDVARSGAGSLADGDPDLAIFGSSRAAARQNGTLQDVTPNHRALALRFGLFDRFFVNSEASPDGHNWSTAAFSTDYVDKAFRWNYSKRGRGYDYEGFNRLPNYETLRGNPGMFGTTVTAGEVANYLRRFIPYLHGSRDVAEPKSLYLWDAASRAGLSYRNYGEFVATMSAADIAAIGANATKSYPDLSANVSAIPTKKALEDHYNSAYRNFDIDTPDAMTVDSYRAAKVKRESALVSKANSEPKFRGTSRLGVWLEEFQGYAADMEAGRTDRMPNLSIVRLPNDHTNGMAARQPTPQFFVADNDYALGLMVQSVSHSPYWKDTAIFVVEDDSQDGADHVDAHRSVCLVVSAYNKPGALVHEFHNTVSMIRTIELLLGIAPMNQLDATATPMDIFNTEPDLKPYEAQLPDVALDNLINPPARDAATAYWMRTSEEQDMSHADLADADVLNRIIWFSVKGRTPMPRDNRLPAFDAMRLGLKDEREEMARR